MPQHTHVYSVEVIEHALDVFHTTDNEQHRRNAEDFLEEFEESVCT